MFITRGIQGYIVLFTMFITEKTLKSIPGIFISIKFLPQFCNTIHIDFNSLKGIL